MTSKQHTYANFGEYIYWSYANLQMLHYALNVGKVKYDRMCYMIRSKAFKAYKEGRWNIHDLLEFNVEKSGRITIAGTVVRNWNHPN